MKRRAFIKESIKAGAAIALSTGGILVLGTRKSSESATNGTGFLPKDRRASDNPQYPLLAAVKSQSYPTAVAEAIMILGGMERFVAKGDRVFVKPNIGWDRTPEQGANTHPEIVAEICRLCFKAGAREVTVADVTCNAAERAYNRSGIKEAAQKQGAAVVLITDSELIDVDFGTDSLGRWPVIRKILECDKLINVPVVKHHSLSGMTAGMKNWFGALAGPRNKLHQDIEFSIAELARLFNPTLTIQDATRVMQKGGPTGGRTEDLIAYHTVVAATDPVAAESYVCRFLSRKPADFPFIKMAADFGLGDLNPPENRLAVKEL